MDTRINNYPQIVDAITEASKKMLESTISTESPCPGCGGLTKMWIALDGFGIICPNCASPEALSLLKGGV